MKATIAPKGINGPRIKPVTSTRAQPPQNPALRWRKETKIGAGAFGELHTAYSTQSHGYNQVRPVFALKSVRMAKLPGLCRQLALEEPNTLQYCQHPFVVDLKDSWVAPGGSSVTMVMDYHEKGDLLKVIESGKLMTPVELRNTLAEGLLALWHLERQGVVHRDIKPSNILRAKAGHMVLTDFGLASRPDMSQELREAAFGTLVYMAPEMMQGHAYSHAVDMWSFGATVYQLATGKVPYTGQGQELFRKVIDPAVKPARLPSCFSPDWERVLGWMMHKDPRQRATVSQLMADPWLKHAVSVACKLAKQLQPDVELPTDAAAAVSIPTACPAPTLAPTCAPLARAAGPVARVSRIPTAPGVKPLPPAPQPVRAAGPVVATITCTDKKQAAHVPHAPAAIPDVGPSMIRHGGKWGQRQAGGQARAPPVGVFALPETVVEQLLGSFSTSADATGAAMGAEPIPAAPLVGRHHMAWKGRR